MLVEVVEPKLEVILYSSRDKCGLQNAYLTWRGCASRRRWCYLKQIILTLFDFKVYSHVDVVELVLLVLLVELVDAKLKWISCLSHKKCGFQYLYLTWRGCARCRSCRYLKHIILMLFRLKSLLTCWCRRTSTACTACWTCRC